jgi:hypothetical protein
LVSGIAGLWRHRLVVRRLVLAALALIVLGQGALYLTRQHELYAALDGMYDDLLRVCRAQPDGIRLGVINLPRGLFREDRAYALTTDDVLFIPPYSNVSEFVAVNGARCDTEAIVVDSIAQKTDPTWLSQGTHLGPSEVREFAEEQDEVWVTQYGPEEGQFALAPAGRVNSATDLASPCDLARFAPGPLLCGAELSRDSAGDWWLRLDWMAAEPTSATVFVHVVDVYGALISQADGMSLAGALPLDAWQPRDRIVDIRRLRVPSDTPGPLQVFVGLYSGAERYAAWDLRQDEQVDAVSVGAIAQ